MIEEDWIEANWNDRGPLVEMDAKMVAYAAWLHESFETAVSGVRREDLVPLYIDEVGYDRAKAVALAKGWIAKNPLGPKGRGCRYYACGLSPEMCMDFDAYQLHYGPFEKERFAEFHYDIVQDMLMSMPGKPFNSTSLKREAGGPCTDTTWPLIREMLNDDDAIDKRGRGGSRTYSFIHEPMCCGMNKPWGELAPDYYLVDFLTGEPASDSKTEGVA